MSGGRFFPGVLRFFLCFILLVVVSEARIHKLRIEDDTRREMDLSTFGFLKGGHLTVDLTSFQFKKTGTTGVDDTHLSEYVFGFTLDKTVSPGISPYLESKSEQCILTDRELVDKDDSVSVVFFKMDLEKRKIVVTRKGEDLKALPITEATEERYNMATRGKRKAAGGGDIFSDSFLMARSRRAAIPPPPNNAVETTTKQTSKPDQPGTKTTNKPPTQKTPAANGSSAANPSNPNNGTKSNTTNTKDTEAPAPLQFVNDSISLGIKRIDNKFILSTHFLVMINRDEQEGLYNLFFHNCYNYRHTNYVAVNFTIHITENNNGNYLSAGQMPLPKLYFTLCVVYIMVGVVWIYVLRSAREGDLVLKTHYLMCVLVFVKAVALLFHAINFYFIQEEGHHEEAWAILYYITMLMKGALLFITIVLIGAGWAFVKHILSDRDKKIFIIVIPLQILANTAQIIIEESEEGQSEYTMWKEIFILVDLLCCGSILFPVVWSIRHLQEASQTDGKAAINLAKLKIFRHFYIMIVCYIYFTRIIVYLLKITVPFEYEWLDELFKEIATFIFFTITGYKFRPASNNPYLQLSMDSDEEVEMDEVLTKSGAYEGLVKVNVKHADSSDAAGNTGPSKRESSHEYD